MHLVFGPLPSDSSEFSLLDADACSKMICHAFIFQMLQQNVFGSSNLAMFGKGYNHKSKLHSTVHRAALETSAVRSIEDARGRKERSYFVYIYEKRAKYKSGTVNSRYAPAYVLKWLNINESEILNRILEELGVSKIINTNEGRGNCWLCKSCRWGCHPCLCFRGTRGWECPRRPPSLFHVSRGTWHRCRHGT